MCSCVRPIYYWSFNAESDILVFKCTVFQKFIAKKTFFPQSARYQAQESTYYSSEQIDQKPGCRVSPTSAADVSFIIKTATLLGCQFAVRSGEHMNWKGSSNIGPTGFTIDTEMMGGTTLSKDKKLASLGPGGLGKEIYDVLDPLGLTVLGTRTSGVGVGGFILRGNDDQLLLRADFIIGGISSLSLEHDFASDNVINYETCRWFNQPG
jgi:FAD/FMN-containing dehydrogenase